MADPRSSDLNSVDREFSEEELVNVDVGDAFF